MMALWQLLALTIVAAATTVSLIGADGYRSRGPYEPSYKPVRQYEDYPSYDRDYSFNYGIKDDSTYNYQTRDEVKKGNTVYGSYSVVEPDGNLRIVKYEADDYGFRATVDREGVPSAVVGPPYVAGPQPPSPPPSQNSFYGGPLLPYLSAHKVAPPSPPVYYGPRQNYVRPVLYKAPMPPSVYSRGNYKAPVYNYDDEY